MGPQGLCRSCDALCSARLEDVMLCSLITTDGWDVTLQKLTRKKALGTGPNCALQAEYALDGSVLITVLKVWYETHHLQPVLSAAGYIV